MKNTKNIGSAKIVVVLLALAAVLGGTIVYSTTSKKDIVSSVPLITEFVQPITEGDLARIGFTASRFPIRTTLSFPDVTGDGVLDGIVEVAQQAGSGSSYFFNVFTRDKSAKDLGCENAKFILGKTTDELTRAVLQKVREACVDLVIKFLGSGIQPPVSLDKLRWLKEGGRFVEIADREGWYVYQGKNKFAVQYPDDWWWKDLMYGASESLGIIESVGFTPRGVSEDFYVGIGVSEWTLDSNVANAVRVVRENPNRTFLRIDDAEMGGARGKKVVSKNNTTQAVVETVFLEHGGLVYVLNGFSYDPSMQQVVRQILDSFRVL